MGLCGHDRTMRFSTCIGEYPRLTVIEEDGVHDGEVEDTSTRTSTHRVRAEAPSRLRRREMRCQRARAFAMLCRMAGASLSS